MIFADPQICPDCRSRLVPGATACQGCGLRLEGPLGQELFATLTRADQVLARMRALTPAPVTLDPAPRTTGVLVGAAGGPGGVDQVPAPTTERAPDPAPTGVRTSAIPRILLGLGALCLLVAAVVFLAVAWSVLGVGGRTTALVVLTAAAAGLTLRTAGRGLRVATESLGLVSLGLLSLDVLGAWHADWFGPLSSAGLVLVLGLVVAAAGTGAVVVLRSTPVGGFGSGEAVVVVGAAMAALGLTGQQWAGPAPRLVIATALVGLAAAGLALLVRPGSDVLRVATAGTALVAALTWCALVAEGTARVGLHADLASVWGRGDGWPLVAAAAMVLAVSAVRPLPVAFRVLAAAAGGVSLGIVLTAPAYDEGTTLLAVTFLVATTLACAVVVLLGRPWGGAGVGAAGAGAVVLAVVGLDLAARFATRYVDVAARAWDGDPAARLAAVPVGSPAPWLLLPVAVVVLAVPASVGWLWRPEPTSTEKGASAAARLLTPAILLAGLGAVATTALYPVPVWLVLAAMLVLLLGVGVRALLTDAPLDVVAAGLAAALALGFSAGAEAHSAVALALTLGLAATLALRSRHPATAAGSALVAVLTLAGLTWTLLALRDTAGTWSALITLLVLSVVLLGGPFLRTTQPSGVHRLGSVGREVGCAAAALAAGVLGVAAAPPSQTASWAAVLLTVAGTAASLLALVRADRREIGWVGGALLLVASWVRLADLGVGAPEPYTVPAATALLLVGGWQLRRRPALSTHRALTPGLGLALTPSLLWVLDEPLTLRALLLGLVCLVLVVLGTQLRWSALLTLGGAVGAVLVLREVGPYVGGALPRWALIGLAGALLTALGITWEERMREARLALAQVRRLR